MSPEDKGVESSHVSEVVELGHVGKHVVEVVGVRGVLTLSPPSIKQMSWFHFPGTKVPGTMVRMDHLSGVGTSLSNIAFSGFDSSSTLSKPVTCCGVTVTFRYILDLKFKSNKEFFTLPCSFI